MIRQYYAQRFRGGDNPLRVGLIPIGAVFFIQEEGWWRDRYRGKPTCRNPWIVEGFLNGTMGAARRNPETGLWENAYRSGRSDMAVVRSLRDGSRREIAVRILVLHEDEGLTPGMNAYPTCAYIGAAAATSEGTNAGRADRAGYRKRPEPR